jgi:predicted NAD/FAD-binding protein
MEDNQETINHEQHNASLENSAGSKPRCAVIGSGISGLGAAFLLQSKFDVTIFEKDSYVGGHSRTIMVNNGKGGLAPVDTGFIVFNAKNYPHLKGMFQYLNVPIQESDMSFGASIGDGFLEYGSKNILAQPKNILRPAFWGMLIDIIRFNRSGGKILDENNIVPKPYNTTLERYLQFLDMGEWFKNYYLLAMGAAIWSSPAADMLQFPAKPFIRFFENHGLLSINQHPQWYTVKGGSREYIKKLIAHLDNKILLNTGIQKVIKADPAQPDGQTTIIDDKGQEHKFDKVVFACHADQALALIEGADDKEQSVLGAFRYQDNTAVTHTDVSFMPKSEKAWASWVYLNEALEGKDTSDQRSYVSLSYWMNNLQNIDSKDPILVTLNPSRRPEEDRILDEHNFRHPVFDIKAILAQREIPKLQGHNNFYYCGAYQRYGFHEDGLLSAVRVASLFDIKPIWQ